MDKLTLLFEEFIQKAMTMTESFLVLDFTDETNFEDFTANRERLFGILNQISEKINWDEVPEERRAELNRQIEYIKKIDEELLAKLRNYQKQVRQQIEQTVRTKEGVKGYNLLDVK